jgi:phage internal scaffolding protein
MIRSHTTWNYDRDTVSIETGISCPEPSLAQQHCQEDVDINNIIYKYTQTGILPIGSQEPTYGDFSMVNDYHTALTAIKNAQNAFNELPANLRERFANDPANLIDFLNDLNNRQEAEKLGLINPLSPIPETQVSE